MQTILPIAVFGGLGLGALAYWDSITRYTNLCNKVSYLGIYKIRYLFYIFVTASLHSWSKNMKISQNFTKKLKKSTSKYALVTTISYSENLVGEARGHVSIPIS